jgi:hypothetical protein
MSGQVHAPAALPPAKEPRTHWIGGWVDPRTGVDDVERRQILLLPGLKLRPLGRPAHRQSLYRLRYSGSDLDGNIILNMKYGFRIRSIVEFCNDGDGLQGSMKIWDLLMRRITVREDSVNRRQYWTIFSYLMFFSASPPRGEGKFCRFRGLWRRTISVGGVRVRC